MPLPLRLLALLLVWIALERSQVADASARREVTAKGAHRRPSPAGMGPTRQRRRLGAKLCGPYGRECVRERVRAAIAVATEVRRARRVGEAVALAVQIVEAQGARGQGLGGWRAPPARVVLSRAVLRRVRNARVAQVAHDRAHHRGEDPRRECPAEIQRRGGEVLHTLVRLEGKGEVGYIALAKTHVVVRVGHIE